MDNAQVKDIEKTGKRVLLHYVNKGGSLNTAASRNGAGATALSSHANGIRDRSLVCNHKGKSKNPKQTFGRAMSRVAISKMVSKRAKQYIRAQLAPYQCDVFTS